LITGRADPAELRETPQGSVFISGKADNPPKKIFTGILKGPQSPH
jgi:hypothetical protein